MENAMRIEAVESRPFAAVVLRTTLAELPGKMTGCYDKVYGLLGQAGIQGIQPQGHNLAVYRPGPDNVFEVSVGVQVSGLFDSVGDLVCQQTPSGRAVKFVHFGPYSGLPKAHEVVQKWLRDSGALSEVNWEIYGDWSDDPAQLRTDVYYLLDPSASAAAT